MVFDGDLFFLGCNQQTNPKKKNRGKQIDHLQQQLKVCEEAREEKQHLAKVAQANLEELDGVEADGWKLVKPVGPVPGRCMKISWFVFWRCGIFYIFIQNEFGVFIIFKALRILNHFFEFKMNEWGVSFWPGWWLTESSCLVLAMFFFFLFFVGCCCCCCCCFYRLLLLLLLLL